MHVVCCSSWFRNDGFFSSRTSFKPKAQEWGLWRDPGPPSLKAESLRNDNEHQTCTSSCKLYSRRKNKQNLRKCKSHQRPTDHYEVQNVPQVSEVGSRVEQQTQVHHLNQTQHVYGSSAWPGKSFLPSHCFCHVRQNNSGVKPHKMITEKHPNYESLQSNYSLKTQDKNVFSHLFVGMKVGSRWRWLQ